MKRFMFVMLCFLAGGLSLGCADAEESSTVPADASVEAAGGDQEAMGQTGQDNGSGNRDDNGSDSGGGNGSGNRSTP